jgi:hypothetical protein
MIAEQEMTIEKQCMKNDVQVGLTKNVMRKICPTLGPSRWGIWQTQMVNVSDMQDGV